MSNGQTVWNTETVQMVETIKRLQDRLYRQAKRAQQKSLDDPSNSEKAKKFMEYSQEYFYLGELLKMVGELGAELREAEELLAMLQEDEELPEIQKDPLLLN